MKPIIRINNLSKQYRLGARQQPSYGTLRDSIIEAVRSPLRLLGRAGGGERGEMLWALRGVGFEVRPGEVCGIIGGNGAGKSTLLKILSRITEPTVGRVELYGRVGSLLEVGTGFHPELSGRENVYLNGAILGMKREEIARKFDEIIAFSEIERFVDTPVKHYSTGMYMRLAFAVAAHLESEILIVDEVLAVGDVAFQKKCLGKMGKVAETGRTVLFVSHNMIAVQSMCDHVVWLEKGELREQGPPAEIISKYLKTSFSALADQTWDDPATAPGNDEVRIHRARVRPADGNPAEPVDVHTPVVVEFEYWNPVPDAQLHLSVMISTDEGYPIFNTGSAREPVWGGKPFPTGLFRSSFRIPGDLLNDGTHRVHLYVIKDRTSMILRLDDVLAFNVEDSSEHRGGWYGKWVGAVRPSLQWETARLENNEGR